MTGGYTRTAGPLTPRMREVLADLAAGKTPQQSALARGVTVGTVYAELAIAKRRLGAITVSHACVLFSRGEL